MRPEDQINAGNGVYEPSDRAKKASGAAMKEVRSPFYGEGMDQGKTTPADEKTNTKPISGGSDPTSYDEMQRPGVDAKNTKVIERGNV